MQEAQYTSARSEQAVSKDSFHSAFGGERKDKRKLRRQRKGWSA